MTRAYLTRHGNGPLPFKLPHVPYSKVEDETNIPNCYQGALRFSWLNMDLLHHAIYSDQQETTAEITVLPNLVVTCMDHLDEEVMIIKNKQIAHFSHIDFLQEIKTYFPEFQLWLSRGASRDCIALA